MNVYYIAKDTNGFMIITNYAFTEILLFDNVGELIKTQTEKDFHDLRKKTGAAVQSKGTTAQEAILDYMETWEMVCSKKS